MTAVAHTSMGQAERRIRRPAEVAFRLTDCDCGTANQYHAERCAKTKAHVAIAQQYPRHKQYQTRNGMVIDVAYSIVLWDGCYR